VRCPLAIIVLLAVSAPASAEDPARLVLGSGVTGFARHNDRVRETTGFLSAEYRGTRDLYRGVKPLTGVLVTTHGAAYLHAGLYRDFAMNANWTATLHFSGGAFARRDGMDLGNTIEFQSGVDLFYRMENGWRLGATLRHISNGGLADSNPGTENLGILVALPLR
jgi:hypothetical protein